MSEPRTYPDGVPSWVDTEQPDPEAAMDFYRRLFGWTFTIVTASEAPFYAIACVAGRDVAGLGAAPAQPAVWHTYIAVDDVDASAARAWAAGAEIVAGPFDVDDAGRIVICNDPTGAPFRLWQARRAPGAQRVNEPGSWHFTDLHTDEPTAITFYSEVFGWAVDELGPATLDHGAAPRWQVTFAVEDRNATALLAERLGAELLSTEDTQWTRTALVRDPQGATFTASQFTPAVALR
jgi:predicted enzyme related to lactoylglutathione lyase